MSHFAVIREAGPGPTRTHGSLQDRFARWRSGRLPRLTAGVSGDPVCTGPRGAAMAPNAAPATRRAPDRRACRAHQLCHLWLRAPRNQAATILAQELGRHYQHPDRSGTGEPQPGRGDHQPSGPFHSWETSSSRSRSADQAGIRQVSDVDSTGIPAAGNVHEVAAQVAPDTRVGYIANDPIVHAHATLLAAGTGLWLEPTNAPHGAGQLPPARAVMATAAILWAVPALCFRPVLYVTVIAGLGGASPAGNERPAASGSAPAGWPRPPRGWRSPHTR